MDAEPVAGEQRLALFAKLYGRELEELVPLARPLEYEEGQIIFEEGEPVFGVYFIDRGKVKLAKRSLGGRRQILKLVGPGEILGEEALFDEQAYSAHARALERTATEFVTVKEFHAFLEAHPRVALKLIEQLSREIKGFQSKLLETSYESSLGRVANLLLSLVDKWGEEEDGGLYIGVKLSRTELAELAGIASETASRLLARLRERGILALDGQRIIIRDRARLAVLSSKVKSAR
ncbi:MAG: Crp/Fnr family transcriptional regulator [Candidatus Acetothermia bacterium]|nr:Crp/Fnr family transcriptional regulator [Candidatus Acetothermia bacterium]MDH7505627.1 Crp/Fnr family transcriptional regulator [Candidatus Acetothermia bacterium]